jgi:hypothetical protein
MSYELYLYLQIVNVIFSIIKKYKLNLYMTCSLKGTCISLKLSIHSGSFPSLQKSSFNASEPAQSTSSCMLESHFHTFHFDIILQTSPWSPTDLLILERNSVSRRDATVGASHSEASATQSALTNSALTPIG